MVIAVDILSMEPLEKVTFVQQDATSPEFFEYLQRKLPVGRLFDGIIR